jgi:2-methylcitrate dehydratase PrpD
MRVDNPLLELGKAAADWHRRPLTEEVQHAARRALLDWFATTLPGCIEPPATLLAQALLPGGGAFCYVSGAMRPPREAALLNATASHTVEFDDIFRDGGYHPGSPTMAAALALAQDRGASLVQFQRAVIAGYEIGSRISLAIQPSHYVYWHTTSTVGTIGAAVASAMLLGCGMVEIAHAIALASSFAGGHQQNLQGEGMAKALHPGHAAEAGMLAAFAAARGVTGSLDSLHGPKGFAAATSDSTGDWDAALAGVGEWTPITRITIKNHGCCGHIFPALDGLEAMQAAHSFNANDIAAIDVAGYGATRSMCDRPNARTAQEARFSVQYCLAAKLVLGTVRLNAFSPEALEHSEIRRLMPKVRVTEDPDLTAAYPRRRMARLNVTLSDGRALCHFQTVRRGDPEDPLSDADLAAKFDELTAGVLAPGTANGLRHQVLRGIDVPGRVPLDGRTYHT